MPSASDKKPQHRTHTARHTYLDARIEVRYEHVFNKRWNSIEYVYFRVGDYYRNKDKRPKYAVDGMPRLLQIRGFVKAKVNGRKRGHSEEIQAVCVNVRRPGELPTYVTFASLVRLYERVKEPAPEELVPGRPRKRGRKPRPKDPFKNHLAGAKGEATSDRDAHTTTHTEDR